MISQHIAPINKLPSNILGFSLSSELSAGECFHALLPTDSEENLKVCFSGYTQVSSAFFADFPTFTVLEICALDEVKHPQFVGYEFKVRTIDEQNYNIIMAYDKREHKIVFAYREVAEFVPCELKEMF